MCDRPNQHQEKNMKTSIKTCWCAAAAADITSCSLLRANRWRDAETGARLASSAGSSRPSASHLNTGLLLLSHRTSVTAISRSLSARREEAPFKIYKPLHRKHRVPVKGSSIRFHPPRVNNDDKTGVRAERAMAMIKWVICLHTTAWLSVF